MTEKDACQLEQLAIRHDRTLSAEIRRALREHLQRTCDDEETGP